MTKPTITAIAALGKNTRNICHEDQLLWRIKSDLQRVKSLTMGKPLIMGRKTFVSIGKALPGRKNIVLTRDKNFSSAEEISVVHSKEEALDEARKFSNDGGEIIIFGGAEIYTLFLPETDKLILTIVDSDKNGTAQFPEYQDQFKEIARERGGVHHQDGQEIDYDWVTFERIT